MYDLCSYCILTRICLQKCAYCKDGVDVYFTLYSVNGLSHKLMRSELYSWQNNAEVFPK